MVTKLIKSPEVMRVRAARVGAAKLKSRYTKNAVHLVVDDEKFVFQGGTLAEYTFTLPEELADFDVVREELEWR